MLIRCFSADHFAGAAPPRVSEEAREHATQAVGEVDGRMLPPRHVDRPPPEEWFTNDLHYRKKKRLEVLAEGRLATHQSAESLAVRLWKINATRVRAKPSPATREERKYASA